MKYFDFRPYASNTVAPATAYASAPLNPSYSLSFGNTSSSANEKKFPNPTLNLTGTIETFVGRMDAVFVNTDGSISIETGVPSTDSSKLYASEAADNQLKISDIRIPTYPNIPLVRSKTLDEILLTKVNNELFLKNRLDNKTITRVSPRNQTKPEQPRVYTHADIGQMDRRLKDVEYQVSLSTLESNVASKIIPSSIIPSLDRFKFGFFVDDYSTYNFLDRNNPTFSAYIEDNCLVPEKLTWTLSLVNFTGAGKYVDYDLVDQLNASTPLDWVMPSCIGVANTANILAYRTQFYDREVGNTVSSYIDTKIITFASSQAVPATLFFYAYDTYSRIEVYQGSNLIRSTFDASALSLTDQTFVLGNDAANWFNDNPALYLKNPVIDVNGYAKYAGKLTWTHDPSKGISYTIKAYKGSGAFRWKYLLQYPVDRATVGCPTPPPDNPHPPFPSDPGPSDWSPDYGGRESVSGADFGLGVAAEGVAADSCAADSSGDSSGDSGASGDSGSGD